MKKVILTFAAVMAMSVAFCQTSTEGEKETKHCQGLKADGDSCKSTFVLKSGYCRAHDPESPKCGKPKKDGEPCKMPVAKAGEACVWHKE